MAQNIVPKSEDVLASIGRVPCYRCSSFSYAMRYHSDKPHIFKPPRHGRTIRCNHPAYSSGTLYFHDGVGFVVIQQRYDKTTKHTWWSEIDQWLVEAIYDSEGFDIFFSANAKQRHNDLYPTFTVRQVMWALRMKPLAKRPWETVFDHKPI